VDLHRSRLVVKRVKNGVWAERPLFESTAKLLRRYLASAAPPPEPLFPSRRGALQKRQVQALFVRYRDAAQLSPQYTCHGLRHSIATHLLDAGAPLEFVKDHLGHRSIQSTTIYAQITDRHRAAVYARLERSPWIVQPEGE
jgi:integrase